MSNDQKYVMSLDAIDLNYMPVYPHREYDKVIPIWTTRDWDSRSDEYVEFEIKDQEELKSEDKNNVVKYDNIWCHLCNIDVPNIFMKEHIVSVKHKTNMRIVNISLNRVKASNNMMLVIKEETKNNIYFCTSCVAIVDMKEKSNHNNSSSHRNAVSIDKVLQNFLFLYSNDDRYTETSEIHDLSKFNDSFEEFTSTGAGKSSISHINTKSSKCEDLNSCVNKNTLNSNSFLHSNDNVNNTTEITENSGKMTSVFCTKTRDSEFSQIDTKSKVTEDNPLNQKKPNKKISNNKLLYNWRQCVNNNTSDSKPNEEIVKSKINTENKSTYNFNEKKLSSENTELSGLIRYIEVLKKTKDLKNVTVFDETNLEIVTLEGTCAKVSGNNFHSFVLDENKLRCLVCSEVIKQTAKEDHIYNNTHMDLLCLPLKDAHCIREIDEFRNHCILCNQLFDDVNSHILLHEHERHKEKALMLLKNLSDRLNIADPNMRSQRSDGSDVAANTDKHLNALENSAPKFTDFNFPELNSTNHLQNNYCDICEINLSNNLMELHLKTKRHQRNIYMKSLKTHYLMEASNNHLTCKICLCAIKNKPSVIQDHFNTEKHLEKYTNLLALNSIKNLKNAQLYCNLCEEELIEMNEITHINETAHTNRLKDTKISQKVQVPNTDSCRLQHNMGANHINNIDTALKSKIFTSSNEKEIFEIHYHMIKNTNQLQCLVCNVKVPLNEKNMMGHIKGFNHIKNYKKIIVKNQLKVVTNGFYCEICNVDIIPKHEILHSLTKEHIRKLNLLKSTISHIPKINPEASNSLSFVKNVSTTAKE